MSDLSRLCDFFSWLVIERERKWQPIVLVGWSASSSRSGTAGLRTDPATIRATAEPDRIAATGKTPNEQRQFAIAARTR